MMAAQVEMHGRPRLVYVPPPLGDLQPEQVAGAAVLEMVGEEISACPPAPLRHVCRGQSLEDVETPIVAEGMATVTVVGSQYMLTTYVIGTGPLVTVTATV